MKKAAWFYGQFEAVNTAHTLEYVKSKSINLKSA
jgi:hypothetical protein